LTVSDIMLAFIPATEAAEDPTELLAAADPEAEPLKMAIRLDSHVFPLFEPAAADCEAEGVALALGPVALDPGAFEPPASALSEA
jgi:hypothetical protein